MKRLLLVLGAIVAVVALGASLAWATIPDAQGVIHGCRRDTTGVLRVIDTDAGQTCAGNETALDWNQTGPAGPPGPGSDYEAITAPLTGSGTTLFCPTGKFMVETYRAMAGVISGGGGGTPVIDAVGRIVGARWASESFEDVTGTIICING